MELCPAVIVVKSSEMKNWEYLFYWCSRNEISLKEHLLFLHRMDSFFLAEMFKYLYLLFADKEDMIFDIEDYIFTTEAHLLPLWLSTTNQTISKKNTVRNSSSLNPFLWYTFFFWGEMEIKSGKVRIVCGSAPVWIHCLIGIISSY